MPFSPAAAVFATPTNPSGTVSATLVMMGLGVAGAGGGWSITPTVSGRVLANISGIWNNAATATLGTIQIYYGTGAAPANGAAVTGTAIGSTTFAWTSLTGQLATPFQLHALATGLTVPVIGSNGIWSAAVPVWFDIAMKVGAANSGTITALSCSLLEL